MLWGLIDKRLCTFEEHCRMEPLIANPLTSEYNLECVQVTSIENVHTHGASQYSLNLCGYTANASLKFWLRFYIQIHHIIINTLLSTFMITFLLLLCITSEVRIFAY